MKAMIERTDSRLPMVPRQTISLATLRTRASDDESAYSTHQHEHQLDHQHQHHHVRDSAGARLAEHLHRLSCLPPVDTGKHAYLFLSACFVLSSLSWSYSFCFGILSDYYARTAPFAGSTAIANIGTSNSGLMYLFGLPALVLNRMYPRWARYSPLVGLFILCGALCASAFASSVSELILTQGILYGIGGAIAYTPCTMYIDEWFVKRKGLAYGIMWSGTSLAGVVLPLLLERLLVSYGYQTTVIVWAVVQFGVTAPLAWYIKPRIPPVPVRSLRAFNLRFAVTRRFILYQMSNTIASIGFFIPGIYVPIFAGAFLGATEFESSLCILIFNTSAVFGCVVLGWLIDRLHVTTCVAICTAGTTLGVFLLWGFSTSMPMLYIFCVSYGLSAGSYTTTWTGVMREVSGKDKLLQSSPSSSSDAAGDEEEGEFPSFPDVIMDGSSSSSKSTIDPVMVFCLMAAGRGIGNIVAGPLSQVMYHQMPWKGELGVAYGSGFGSLIIFTGITSFLSGLCVFGRQLGWC